MIEVMIDGPVVEPNDILIIPPDPEQEMYYLKAKKQHIMWYFTKFCFSFFIILMFWSQIEAGEGKPGNEFRELTCLRIYCYLNLIEYAMTLLYNAFIILLYDKYHKPTQD